MATTMPKPQKTPNAAGKRKRCAIYTRKSSEEGLEQAFNSLDAQREACAAFILSQKHEGWAVLPTLYDDGGFSGGTMERPALQRLLADICAGKVDVVVVKKGELSPRLAPPLSLSLLFARDSIATRLRERVEYRATRN
jgi:site-specific DNA recombinase